MVRFLANNISSFGHIKTLYTCIYFRRNNSNDYWRPNRKQRLMDFPFQLNTSDFCLHTSDFRILTSDFLLHTSYSRPPTEKVKTMRSELWNYQYMKSEVLGYHLPFVQHSHDLHILLFWIIAANILRRKFDLEIFTCFMHHRVQRCEIYCRKCLLNQIDHHVKYSKIGVIMLTRRLCQICAHAFSFISFYTYNKAYIRFYEFGSKLNFSEVKLMISYLLCLWMKL